MSLFCTRCGTEVANGWIGICPKCGNSDFASSTNYSGTVTFSGSADVAINSIFQARGVLISVAKLDKKRAAYLIPIIAQLEAAAKMTKQQEVKIASIEKPQLDEYVKKIEEYRGLVDSNAEEKEFQLFFEENPVFLDQKMKMSIPKKSFGGENFPDFLLILHDSSYLVVEIEKPKIELFNDKGDPTSGLTHGQQQVRRYLRWAIEEKEFLRKRECPNIGADNTKGLLVIGKKNDLNSTELGLLENLNAEATRSRYEIKTFDRILEENQVIYENLRKMAERNKN